MGVRARLSPAGLLGSALVLFAGCALHAPPGPVAGLLPALVLAAALAAFAAALPAVPAPNAAPRRRDGRPPAPPASTPGGRQTDPDAPGHPRPRAPGHRPPAAHPQH